jgi:hypothetical protein
MLVAIALPAQLETARRRNCAPGGLLRAVRDAQMTACLAMSGCAGCGRVRRVRLERFRRHGNAGEGQRNLGAGGRVVAHGVLHREHGSVGELDLTAAERAEEAG